MPRKNYILILLFLPLFCFSQGKMTIYMGRYDISKVDSINPTTNQFTGVFVDELGSYTSLDADTNDRVIQRGYDLFGRVVYDSYRIIGIISRDAENLVVNVVSDNTSGIRNRDGMPGTGSFPLTTSLNDTSKFIFQISPYQNRIDFDYDAAIYNINLNELFYHNHSGTYEPSISKSTGYAKWTGSAWNFVNETYVTGTPWTAMGYVTGTPWTSMGYLTGYTETDPLVSAWAKAATKPSYSYSEVGAASSGHDHSGTYEPSISKSTGYAKWTGSAWSFVNDTYVTGTPWTSMGYVTGTPWTSMGYITGYTETDPLVSAWAKAGTKPSYSYSEVGAASSGHDHSGTYEPSIPKTGAGYLIYSAGAWSWLNEVYLKDDVRWYTNETGVSHFCIAPNTYLGGKTLKQVNLFTSLIISRYGGFSWGGATPPYALYVNGFSRFDSTANFTKNIKVSDSISGPKFRITKEGGYAVKMTAGENLQRGRIVVSEDDGSVSKVYNIANSSNIPIGIVYDTAVNGNSVWVVINGIADIKVELDGGAYNGYIIGIYDDGDGFVDGSATAIDSYFHIYGCSLPWAFPVKIGTWIETKSTAGWAKGIVNIQPVQMISSCP